VDQKIGNVVGHRKITFASRPLTAKSVLRWPHWTLKPINGPMNLDRWQQIEKIYHSALEHEPRQRQAFLREACAGDEALRKEVESLLAHQLQAESFIEAPALEVAAKGMAQNQAQSLVGRQSGPYKIQSLLGVGGMGEVYLAQDPRLDRAIALKILPTELASDPDRIRRFIREARAASGLKHANVAHIYEIGQSDGLHFIAMEYVEGQSLAQKMSGQPLELKGVLDIGIQAADALEEAHRKGITHRDVKSANLMITPKGQVKVLDFGLAKISRPEGEAPGSDVSTSIHTVEGVVMGTLRYMSPEQVLGKELDARTDLFSLGVVLYEMTTGRLPFSGSHASEVMDRILHAQPEAISRFNYNVPPELEWIVRKCLEKDRDTRYQSAHELLIDLRSLKREERLGPTAEVTVQSWSHVRRFAVAAITVAIIAILGMAVYLITWRSSAIDSVAVLPFVNASADPNNEYLSDGIAESLINSLSQLPKLRVKSRNSVFRYKGKETDVQTVGRELGVRAVLTGRVTQRGDGLLIGVELVDARDNNQIWGEHYNRKFSDIVAVQQEISKEITENLRLRLTGEEQKRLTKPYTENTEAYQLYLKGRYHWNKRPQGLKEGIKYFEQAIEKDPSYALAYTGLADSYGALGTWEDGTVSPAEAMPKAAAAAIKALKIDETLAEAHTSLAYIKLHYDWDWLATEKELKRAIELNPSYANAHHWYSHYWMTMGRTQESLIESNRAVELDPLDPIFNGHLAWHYYYSRQYDQVIEQCRKIFQMNPDLFWPHFRLGLAYEQKAMFGESIVEFSKTTTLARHLTYVKAALGYTYALSGQRNYAQNVLDQLKELSKQRYVSSSDVAIIYVGLSEKDQAFAWLQKAYQERSWHMVLLKVDPRLDNLRSDARFKDLLRRVGLPP